MGRRNFMRRAGQAITALAVAPVVGATTLKECRPEDPSTWGGRPSAPSTTTTTTTTTSTTTTTTTTTVPPASRALTGYNLFSWSSADPGAVRGVEAMQPGMVRWNVEWDRYQPTPNPVDWSRTAPFLNALEAVGTVLYLQVWTQRGIPAWARTHTYQNIPKPGTYEQFVAGLEAFVANFDIEVIWGMYNEPDLRFGLKNIDGSFYTGAGAPENYHTPWTWSLTDPFRGHAFWTGGSGEQWDRLHAVGANRVHTTNGMVKPAWIATTARHYDIVDLHIYMVGRDVDYYLARVRDQLGVWETVRPGLPFVVGEIATASGPDVPGLPNDTPQEKGLIRERHEAVAAEWGDRYLGMLSLSEGQRWYDTVGWWAA